MATIAGGILGGDRAEITRGIAELERKEAAAERRAAEQALTEQEIEWALGQVLRDELAAEIESQKLDAQTLKRYREDFAQFRKYAEDSGLSYLPAGPSVVALFLSEHGERGYKHFRHQCNAIACAHRMAGFPDPTNDLLVLALGRLLKNNHLKKSSTSATPAQH